MALLLNAQQLQILRLKGNIVICLNCTTLSEVILILSRLSARDHRDEKQQLAQLKMCRLECKVKVHVYEPLPEYCHSCPWTLVVCRGIHTHPIPILQKTPPSIRAEVVKLLKSLDNDLADLTPWRFIRHPITKSYLISCFPSVILPSLSSLHISLANRSHLKYYIDEVKQELFPAGTGWEGMIYDCSLNPIYLNA